MKFYLAALLVAGLFAATAAEPVVPVGEDAYLMWERWAQQRIGVRAYMRSTYDRRGGNESADASHFLYQLADDNNVTLDVAGTGVLYFARYNHWHGSPWRYVVDGTEHIVQESSSRDPERPVEGSVFIPERLFPKPLAWTWSMTKGADLSWVPIAFERSFRMGYSRTRYGTGYYIYHLYDRAAKLSRPITTWETNKSPDERVLDFVARAGTDISPRSATETKGTIERLGRNETKQIVHLTSAPSSIRKISFSVPQEEALAFGRSRLRLTWDDCEQASVDAPVALFFGAGTLYNRDGREYLVRALPSYIRYAEGRVELACFFPMPFFKSARVELIGAATNEVKNISWSIKHEPFRDPANQVGYFHATFRDFPNPELGKDLVLLDTREAEGGGDWSGNFVGMSWIFSMEANLGTLEGDPRFFFDDSESPQAYGTGTEEWGGGGDYWGGLNMTLPFAGHPVGARNVKEAKDGEDKIQSAYRFLLADLMPFGRNAVIRLEHGGRNESTEHYRAVTYWYGAPRATLVKTDTLKIGDGASEEAHQYKSPDASEPYDISSRYEVGVDTVNRVAQGAAPVGGKDGGLTTEPFVVCPPHTDRGRKTRTTSEFMLKLDPKNLGVLLRRKLDYTFANQRAEVFVAPGDIAEPSESDFKSAGIWYLAGSNTCVYSDPRGELGATQHNVQTSNRRFRDDEFIVPRDLTEGRSSIRVRIKFIPVSVPLFPGHPLGELAWSEIRYDAFCYLLGD
jgi:hypothetical protein